MRQGDEGVLGARLGHQRGHPVDAIPDAELSQVLPVEVDRLTPVEHPVTLRFPVAPVDLQDLRDPADAAHFLPRPVAHHDVGQVLTVTDEAEGVGDHRPIGGGQTIGEGGGEQAAVLAHRLFQELGMAGAYEADAVPHQQGEHERLHQHHAENEAGGKAQTHHRCSSRDR